MEETGRKFFQGISAQVENLQGAQNPAMRSYPVLQKLAFQHCGKMMLDCPAAEVSAAKSPPLAKGRSMEQRFTGHRCKTCRNVSFIAFHCDKLLVFTRVRLYVLKLDMAHSMTDLAMPCQSSAAYLFATAAAAALVPNKATEALVLKRISDPCDLDLLLFNGKRGCFERELGHATVYELQSDKGKTVQMSKSCLHQKMIRTKNTLPQHKH